MRKILWTLALMGSALSSHAVTLSKDWDAYFGLYAQTPLPGTSVTARPELDGTVLEELTQRIDFDGLSFTVLSRVVRESASGTLDFYWRICDIIPASTTGGFPGAVTRFSLFDFGYAHLNDADWLTGLEGTVGVEDAVIFRPEVVEPIDGYIAFDFDGRGVSLNSESAWFFIHTSARNYAKTALYELSYSGVTYGHSDPYTTFAPAVPEPGTWLLMVGGLLTVALKRGGRGLAKARVPGA